MKKMGNASAFSLIELIVAMVLFSFIALGIVSINTAMVNDNTDFGQRYSVRSQTQTTLNHILNNAALAVGSANANDEAILVGAAGVGDANSFCIHQAGTASGGQNLIGSAADIWLCYSFVNTVVNSHQIEWCAETYPAAAVASPGSVADPRGASSCPAAGGPITFLGSAFTISPTGFTAPSFNYRPGGAPLQFSINILNCLDNSSSTCVATGSTDQANNPSVTLSGNVTPLQASGGA